MKYLLKAELYKFKKDRAVWYISTILILCASISIFTGIYSSAENTFLNLGKECMTLMLACAIYAGITLTEEFVNRTIIHAIVAGYKRYLIIIAKCIYYILGCTMIIVSYLTISTLLAAFKLGVETSVLTLIQYMLICLLQSLPLYWAFVMIFFLYAIIIRRGTVTMGVSIAYSIILVVFANKIYFSTNSVAETIFRLAFTIQLPLIVEKTAFANGYVISFILSIFVIIGIICFCCITFHKSEL